MDRALDLVVYGATGFTGGLVAEYLANNNDIKPDRWAIAGRNDAKLEAVKARLVDLNPACKDVTIIAADSDDIESLSTMTSQTRALVTTVGPYDLHGEPLVKACLESDCHYLDITGEPAFVKRMLEKYDAEAKRRNVLIINCCGFDSIPADLGAYYNAQQFKEKQAITVKAFVRSKGTFSGGTWASAINAMAEGKLGDGSSSDKSSKDRIPTRIHKDKEAGKWAVPMPVIDPWMAYRSASACPDVYGEDFQYGQYIGLNNPLEVGLLVGGVGLIYAGAQIPLTRKLLLNFRKSGEGPSAEQRAKSYFKLTFYGNNGQETVTTSVRGGDPGYTETSKMLSESALTVLHNYDDLHLKGGVVTPAGALGNHLIQRLQGAGIEFSVH